jgi:hypothetical protein
VVRLCLDMIRDLIGTGVADIERIPHCLKF